MSSETLTSDKVAPLLKKPDTVILIVHLFSVVAAKISKGKIEQLSTARGIDQKLNARNAVENLKATAGRLPKNLIVASHEVALTSVPVAFGQDVSLADANQALVWQLSEIIGDVFPTPTMQQVVDSTLLLDDEKFETWKGYTANGAPLPNVDQTLTTLGLMSEEEIDTIHRKLEHLTPQSLEQLHLGWRPMAAEETAVFAIRKELRQNWLSFAKDQKFNLVAMLPIAIPALELLTGTKGHFSVFTPAKVTTYYYEKGMLTEVKEFPRQGPLLPESWVVGLNQPGEADQTMMCSKRDGDLLRRYMPPEGTPGAPTLAVGDDCDEMVIQNILDFATMEPDKRSLPFISPLEPLPPLKSRRLPYYLGAGALAGLAATGVIYPKLQEEKEIDKQLANLQRQKANIQSELANMRSRKAEADELEAELTRLRERLGKALETSPSEQLANNYGEAKFHLDVLTNMANSITPQIALDSFTSNNKGETTLQGTAPTISQIQKFCVPFLKSHTSLGMPPHTMKMDRSPQVFGFNFSVGPQ